VSSRLRCSPRSWSTRRSAPTARGVTVDARVAGLAAAAVAIAVRRSMVVVVVVAALTAAATRALLS